MESRVRHHRVLARPVLARLQQLASGTKLYSWDATNPSTGAVGDPVVTKSGCASIPRPDGSSAITALEANTADGSGFCIDFARSSGPRVHRPALRHRRHRVHRAGRRRGHLRHPVHRGRRHQRPRQPHPEAAGRHLRVHDHELVQGGRHQRIPSCRSCRRAGAGPGPSS